MKAIILCAGVARLPHTIISIAKMVPEAMLTPRDPMYSAFLRLGILYIKLIAIEITYVVRKVVRLVSEGVKWVKGLGRQVSMSSGNTGVWILKKHLHKYENLDKPNAKKLDSKKKAQWIVRQKTKR